MKAKDPRHADMMLHNLPFSLAIDTHPSELKYVPESICPRPTSPRCTPPKTWPWGAGGGTTTGRQSPKWG